MRNLICTLMFGSCLVALSATAPAEPPPTEDDAVVVFRRETHRFTGKDREKLVRTAAKLLSDARIGPPLAEDDPEQKQLKAIRERSCVTVRFAKPPTENVVSLVIPFSPDLDPQTLYALAGPHVRRVTHFANRTCDDLRTMLMHAEIYPSAPGATVTGTARVTGKPPEPRVWDTDAAIQERFGLTRYTEETWLVGPDNGLRNCVVTLRDRDADRRMTPRPLAKAASRNWMGRGSRRPPPSDASPDRGQPDWLHAVTRHHGQPQQMSGRCAIRTHRPKFRTVPGSNSSPLTKNVDSFDMAYCAV